MLPVGVGSTLHGISHLSFECVSAWVNERGYREALWDTVKVLVNAVQSTYHFLVSPRKILRQFEALMGGGGSSHTQRQEAENHQPPPLLTSTDSQSRLPHPVDPADHVSAAERDSPGKPPDDGHPDKELPQNQSGQSGAAGVQTDHESADFNADGGASPPTAREPQLPCVSRLSLFSGMQLVTKGRAQCHREQMVVGGDGDDEQSPAEQQPSVRAAATPSSAPAESSQPPSAFSFLNL